MKFYYFLFSFFQFKALFYYLPFHISSFVSKQMNVFSASSEKLRLQAAKQNSSCATVVLLWVFGTLPVVVLIFASALIRSFSIRFGLEGFFST